MNVRHLALLAAVVAMAACTEVDIENRIPTADAVLTNQLTEAGFIMLEGETVTVQLDGSGSSDEDGTIVDYTWRRTDISNSERYGLGDAGAPDPLAEPIQGQTLSLDLPAGEYRFSLWVTDDDGAIGAPASVSFSIQAGSAYMPDEACLAAYPHPVATCAECVCTPADNDPPGCLDVYQLCYENDDAEFARLCSELVDCAIENECAGATCLGPCADEIDAASTYNGGTAIADCSGGDPQVNPCAASSQGLAVCTPANCGDFCPAFM